jgi:hypothetical protein
MTFGCRMEMEGIEGTFGIDWGKKMDILFWGGINVTELLMANKEGGDMANKNGKKHFNQLLRRYICLKGIK